MNQGKKIISSAPLTAALDFQQKSVAPKRSPLVAHQDAHQPTDGAQAGDDWIDGTTEAELRQFEISATHHGARLDKALAELVPEFSRSYLRQLLEAGGVVVNGVVANKPSRAVKAGDCGSVELRATPQSQAFKPETMDLNVVFEDAYLRIIHKPAGLVVHPAPGNWSGTLLNGLLARDTEMHAAQGMKGELQSLPRAGIVHRLDKDTSGLMVVARQRAVMDALVKLIAERAVSRQYLALAHRPWVGAAQRVVEAPLGRDPKNRLRMAVVDLARTSGKAAKTSFELIQNAAAGCLVHCTLHTGRTHQIRVHLSSIGHALVGDSTYGGAAAVGLTRQALHAYRLAFVHPVTGESLDFRAPLPQDLSAALASWGLSYN